jgi:hypothetical protein
VSTIVKGMKRAMAAEYSRELSAKVFKGQRKLVELGDSSRAPAIRGPASSECPSGAGLFGAGRR